MTDDNLIMIFAVVLALTTQASQSITCESGVMRCEEEGEMLCCGPDEGCLGGECAPVLPGDSQCDAHFQLCILEDGSFECCGAGRRCTPDGCLHTHKPHHSVHTTVEQVKGDCPDGRPMCGSGGEEECCEEGEICDNGECMEPSSGGACSDQRPLCGGVCCTTAQTCESETCNTPPILPMTRCVPEHEQGCGNECCFSDQLCVFSEGEFTCQDNHAGLQCENGNGKVTTCLPSEICSNGKCERKVGKCVLGKTYCSSGNKQSESEYSCCDRGLSCVAGECSSKGHHPHRKRCGRDKTRCGNYCCTESQQCIEGKCKHRRDAGKRCDIGEVFCETTIGDYICCNALKEFCNENGECEEGPRRLGSIAVDCALQVPETCYGQAMHDPGMVCAQSQEGLCTTAFIEEAANSCAQFKSHKTCEPVTGGEDTEECIWSGTRCVMINQPELDLKRLKRTRRAQESSTNYSALAAAAVFLAIFVGLSLGVLSTTYCDFQSTKSHSMNEKLTLQPRI